MLEAVDSALHRIEALPGAGRYAVTFRTGSGVEQSAVAQIAGERVELAAAGLPPDWQAGRPAFGKLVEALVALDRARRTTHAPTELIDVEGGWDVMIGNVVLELGLVTCASHGSMQLQDAGVWLCLTPDCGARAIFAPA
jgi:hypothetical protein